MQMVPWLETFNTFYLVTYSSFIENRLSLSELKDCSFIILKIDENSLSSHQETQTIFAMLKNYPSCLECW